MITILLLEDDTSIQDVMRLIFREPEYRLILCEDPADATADNRIIPDIYLIDKHLSGYDGCELCRIFKADERSRDVPVLMLSATPNIKQLAAEAGADGAIEKPFKVQTLREKIYSILSPG